MQKNYIKYVHNKVCETSISQSKKQLWSEKLNYLLKKLLFSYSHKTDNHYFK